MGDGLIILYDGVVEGVVVVVDSAADFRGEIKGARSLVEGLMMRACFDVLYYAGLGSRMGSSRTSR